MDTFQVGLQLVDVVSAPGKRAAEAIKQIKTETDKAKKALNFGSEVEKAEHQLKRLKADPGGYKKLIEAQKELAEQRKKLGRTGFMDAFKERFSFGKMVGASFLGEMLAEGMIEGAKKAVEIVYEGIKKAFEAGAAAENLRLGARLSLGKGAGEFNEDVGRFAKLTGFDDDAIKSMLLPLRRAGFSQKGARSAFAIAADMAAGLGKGGDQGAVAGNLDTLTDIMLKGGVGEKRLVSMGINAPDFYKALAKKLKTTAATAKERAEGGKVDPQLLINTIGEAVEKTQGGKLGTGAIEYGKTFEARAKKLINLPEEYLKAVSESPAWTALSDRMGKALEALDPDGPRGQKIVGALIKAFEKLVGYVDEFLSPANIDRFADGAARAAEMLGQIPSILDKVVTVSEVLATVWAGSKIVGAVSSLVTLLPGIGAAAGGVTAAVAGMAAPLAAVGGAVASLALAYSRISSTADELGGWEAVKRDFKDWGAGKGPALATDEANSFSPQWKKDRAAGKTVQVQAPMVMQFYGPVDEQTAKQVAPDIHQHATNAFERAAQEHG